MIKERLGLLYGGFFILLAGIYMMLSCLGTPRHVKSMIREERP